MTPADDVPAHLQLPMRLASIFMPQGIKHQEQFHRKGNPARLVHYTSAEAALNIIRTKRLWMRNAKLMADYREVQHGLDLLDAYFADRGRKRQFFRLLEACVPRAADLAFRLFQQWRQDLEESTYIASVSEHDRAEDQHGRLSMWRAFGSGTARVAIVIKAPHYSSAGVALNVLVSPVEYFSDAGVAKVIRMVMKGVRQEREFLREISPSHVVNTMFLMLVAGATCLKHEGFQEEREWRIVFSPNRSNSPFILSSTEIVGGVPQTIYKLPLDKTAGKEIADLDIANIFDRIIIGPSLAPEPLCEIFVAELTAAGVADATKRVVVSGIPIR